MDINFNDRSRSFQHLWHYFYDEKETNEILSYNAAVTLAFISSCYVILLNDKMEKHHVINEDRLDYSILTIIFE